MKIKLCEDDGFLRAVALPDGAIECDNGPILGPPEGLRKEVSNELALAGIYNAFDLIGNRLTLIHILKKLDIPTEYAREVIHIYQIDYFGEKDE